MPTTPKPRRPGRSLFQCTIGLIALAASLPSAAQTIVFDQGPSTGTYAGDWTNRSDGQNFADKATLTSTTTIMAIDSFTDRAPYAATVRVKILADNGSGQPGSLLYGEDKAPDSWTLASGSIYRLRVVLSTPFVAQGGTTYWYGVAGVATDIGQDSVKTPGDGAMAQFSGTSFQILTAGIGDMMFQLEGPQAQGIPAVHGLGLAALAALLALLGAATLRRLA